MGMKPTSSNRTLLRSCLKIALLCNALAAHSQEIPPNVRAVVEVAITRMRPALVRIHVVSTEYREGREMKMHFRKSK